MDAEQSKTMLLEELETLLRQTDRMNDRFVVIPDCLFTRLKMHIGLQDNFGFSANQNDDIIFRNWNRLVGEKEAGRRLSVYQSIIVAIGKSEGKA